MIQNRRNRVQSAKPYSQRQRPLSSKVSKVTQKTDLIQKIYTNVVNLHDRPTSGRQKIKANSLYFGNIYSNIPGAGIQKQALQQQNLQLKKKVHFLEQEVAKLNGRMESYKSKISKANGALSMEFQYEALWTGKNSYLVTGVKSQYQKLKAKYKQKCDQLDFLKRIEIYTNLKQMQKQNMYLKNQNKKLSQNILQLEKKCNIVHNSSEIFKGQQGKVNQMMISQLQFKLASMEEKIGKRNQQLSTLRHHIQLQHTRVKFLQKLIIQKDNSLHALHLKNKKLQKEKLFYLYQIDQITNKVTNVENQYQGKINNAQEIEQKKNSRQKQIYLKTIQDKNLLIEKLQKQVAYLTTLLSYWKPLDDEKQPSSTSYNNKKNTQSPERYAEQQREKNTKDQEVLNANTNPVAQNSTHSFNKIKATQQSIGTGPRTQKRADKKRSETSKKVRRVKDNEVHETGELIKFRLIAQRISIQNAKQFFNKVPNPQNTQEEEAWQKEYISMKQTQKVLKKSPFFLSDEQVYLLSRYMVEDVMNDYIYCDEENENRRDIVKSILKNIVGEYSVEKTSQQIEREMQVELGKYKSKISTILQQMYPGGLISKRKFIEIIVGSGSEIQEDVLDYMLGKIAIKSQNLNNLTYRVLI